MKKIRFKCILFMVLCIFSPITFAETNYVVDELQIGLHKDPATNSPIIKLVPSGTALIVIERNNELVLVQDPEGARGWVHSKYLIDKKPGRAQLVELENENAALNKEIELLKAKTSNVASTSNNPEPNNASKDLEQQLNSERLKVGELQAQLTSLKTNIGQIDNSDDLLNQIELLKNENQQLINQLQSSGIELTAASGSAGTNLLFPGNWKQIAITFLIIFVLGMAGGAFALDFLNRRRHGGFRV